MSKIPVHMYPAFQLMKVKVLPNSKDRQGKLWLPQIAKIFISLTHSLTRYLPACPH